MLAARRTLPLAHDFTSALAEHQLTLDSLLPHLDPPVSRSAVQPLLSVEKRDQDDDIQQARLIDQILAEKAQQYSFVPHSFPALPSRHTFKSDAVYRLATLDAKQIREQATVEGRLGEEALRRLMSKKASDDEILLTGPSTERKKTARQQSRDLWKATFKHALQANKETDPPTMRTSGISGPGSFQTKDASHVGPAINAESIYWRKRVARRVGEPPAADG